MLRGQPCFEGSTYARFHFQAEPNFESIRQSLLKSCSSSLLNLRNSPPLIEDFQSGRDGYSRFYAPTGGSMHLRSEIMQKLKVTTITQIC